MLAQQSEAPSRRRTTFIAVALLLVALAVGAVTAVRLFPTRAGSVGMSDRATRAETLRLDELAKAYQTGSQGMSDRATRAETLRLDELAKAYQTGSQGMGDRATRAETLRLDELAKAYLAGR